MKLLKLAPNWRVNILLAVSFFLLISMALLQSIHSHVDLIDPSVEIEQTNSEIMENITNSDKEKLANEVQKTIVAEDVKETTEIAVDLLINGSAILFDK